MASFFSALANIWTLLFSWMPPLLGAYCEAIIGLVAIILIIKVIALVLDAIPFL